jgi:tetratricopeptide (TPR) repeat protein
MISPHEVAEQIVFALKTKDPARFQLLLTPEELKNLGFGKAREESTATSLKAAPAAFSQILAEQKAVTPQTRFVDFGSARPGAIPVGTDGSTKDIIICDNGTALVQNDAKNEQIFLGTLVQVGNTWKLIEAPVVGAENQKADSGFFAQVQQSPASAGGDNAPSDEMQKLMAEYERLDRASENLPPEQIGGNVQQRIETLKKLAEIAPAGSRDEWYRQAIDVLSVAIQSGNFAKGVDLLAELQKQLESEKAGEDLIAHAAFQNMWSQFALAQHAPNANMAELQTKWLADLEKFVKTYTKSADTAEALFQLGMYQEFMGNNQEAIKWYQQLVTNFPKVRSAERATGALTRLNSLGKQISIRGKDLSGGAPVDLVQYRGKAVLIQYWATWSDPAKADMAQLNNVYSKRGGRSGDFEIISICLDDNPAPAKQFIAENKYPWKNIYEPGGLESRLANEMGVMTVPLMLLVDSKGTVVNQNVHAPELEGELAKLSPNAGAAGTANALRGVPTSR